MFVSNVQKETVGLVTNLYQYYTGQLSSVPALVAFKLQIDGVQLTPVGGFNGKSIQAFSLSDLHEGEITYERVAAFLINSEINLAATFSSDEVELPDGVIGYKKTVRVEGGSQASKGQGHIVIVSTGDLLSKENEFDCCGDYKVATFEFLFVPRKQTKRLPLEFQGFRIWNNWLTLGNSYTEVAKVSFVSDDETKTYQVKVEPLNSSLNTFIVEDLYALSATLLPK